MSPEQANKRYQAKLKQLELQAKRERHGYVARVPEPGGKSERDYQAELEAKGQMRIPGC